MSRFFTNRYADLTPYTPGEQPTDMQYIKLNTNESPFPPSKGVAAAALKEVEKLPLYSDPECTALRQQLAAVYKVKPEQLLMTNGSDEILNFAFMAFADETRPLLFPDITYGFYPVFAKLNHIPFTTVPLREDFSINSADYINTGKTVVIANPNAPTGLALPLSEIEKIVQSNPDSVVIIDEAYVDFGAQSAVLLVNRYDNLLVTQTFSKSRSMAGARLGFGIGSAALIQDLNTVKYSTNPYNVNRLTAACGIAALLENDYYMQNCQTIIQNREWTAQQLRALGFTVLESKTNFLFAKSNEIGGKALYEKLKQRGILVRHFDAERIQEYNRITVGTLPQMQTLIANIQEILKESVL